jgi:hypothetical protein
MRGFAVIAVCLAAVVAAAPIPIAVVVAVDARNVRGEQCGAMGSKCGSNWN